eukprot:CAMPEP_0172049674 /NCGR_PEP_ID=MMETSP1043-20130122/2203_1 /TAXON_ID=464988 /ORGANISM="Hemiselmis andersenii, Strain CCMP441" /LENGTH=94 /DNA_ID=CAMNT_0012708681 /DNA_START=27 /DNA_END=307 /DNA_ORIENTATION=+
MDEKETMAFQMGQMGYESTDESSKGMVEYNTGSGTITVTRKGTKTVLTVETVEDKGGMGWLKALTSFIGRSPSPSLPDFPDLPDLSTLELPVQA